MEDMRVAMGQVAKRVRCSYPDQPQRAQQAAAGVMCAINAKYRVTHWMSMPSGQWAITILAPTDRRPSRDVARALQGLGFIRTTNHRWQYPVLTPPDWPFP